MERILTTLTFLFPLIVFGQMERQIQNFSEIPESILVDLNKIGVDTSQVLNEYEGNYLNFVFKVCVQNFDFIGKKIEFLHAGKKDKKDYFDDEKERLYNRNTTVNGTLYIFNEKQKEEAGGYDAVIVYWSKKMYSSKDLLKKLKEK